MKKFLTLILFATLLSCATEQQIQTESIVDHPIFDESKAIENANLRRTSRIAFTGKTMTIGVIIDQSKVLEAGSQAKAEIYATNYMKRVCDSLKKQNLSFSLNNVVFSDRTILDREEAVTYAKKFGGTIKSDLVIYLSTGRTGTAMKIGGIGDPDWKYVSVLAGPLSSISTLDLANANHDIGHAVGATHTHECYYGPTNRETIDNLASLYYNEFWCNPADRKNPKDPSVGTAMSYGMGLPNKTYAFYFHPYNEEQIKDNLFANQSKIGCYNTVYNVKQVGNTVTWSDDEASEWKVEYNGVDYPVKSKTVSPRQIKGTIYTSGNTGMRFDDTQLKDTIWFDKKLPVLPNGKRWLFSLWKDGKDIYGGANKVTNLEYIVVPTAKFPNRLQVRPEVDAELPKYITLSRPTSEKGGSFQIPNPIPNSWATIKIKSMCDNLGKKFNAYIAPLNFNGAILTDTGGSTGMYQPFEDITQPIPAVPWKSTTINFDTFSLGDNGDKFIITANGKLTIYNNGNKPTAISSSGDIIITFQSNGRSQAQGWKFNVVIK